MQTPRIYVDFQNADERGRLRLNCAGTTHDLARQGVRLYEGLAVTLYSDDADEAGRPAELRAAQYVRAFCAIRVTWLSRLGGLGKCNCTARDVAAGTAF